MNTFEKSEAKNILIAKDGMTTFEAADKLDGLQREKNEGRGIGFVKHIISCLRDGDVTTARAVATHDADKIGDNSEIRELIKNELFRGEASHPWSVLEELEARRAERRPKQEIADAKERFADYCGNALNGVVGELHNYEERGREPERRQRVLERPGSFFRRVDIFLDSDFEETGNVTEDNLRKLLSYRERVFADFDAIHEMDGFYHSLVD